MNDANGQDVAVALKPSRVVSLSEPTTDKTLALQVTPVGVVSGHGQSGVASYLADRAGDIEILGSVGTPNLEAIGAAHPDLIPVDGTSVKSDDAVTLSDLNQIAPVFYAANSGDEWRETFTRRQRWASKTRPQPSWPRSMRTLRPSARAWRRPDTWIRPTQLSAGRETAPG